MRRQVRIIRGVDLLARKPVRLCLEDVRPITIRQRWQVNSVSPLQRKTKWTNRQVPVKAISSRFQMSEIRLAGMAVLCLIPSKVTRNRDLWQIAKATSLF